MGSSKHIEIALRREQCFIIHGPGRFHAEFIQWISERFSYEAQLYSVSTFFGNHGKIYTACHVPTEWAPKIAEKLMQMEENFVPSLDDTPVEWTDGYPGDGPIDR